jgi:hypothetical protein
MRITVDDRQVRQLFERAPDAVTRRLKKLVEAAAVDVQREMRIAAPVAVTGQLRGSIRYIVRPLRIQAEIKPEVQYAEFVEAGTRPHLVSVAEGTPLRAWAKLKGINPSSAWLRLPTAMRGMRPARSTSAAGLIRRKISAFIERGSYATDRAVGGSECRLRTSRIPACVRRR